MKYFFIILLAATGSSKNACSQVSFGVKAGLNLANAYEILKSGSYRIGVNGGLLIKLPLTKKIELHPEILYSIKGCAFPPAGLSGKGFLSLNYVSIPILVGFQPNEKFTILLGPELDFLTSAISKFDDKTVNVSSFYKKFDIGIAGGGVYNLNGYLGIDFRYCHGLGKLFEGAMTDQYGNEIGRNMFGYNSVFQLGIVYKLSGK